MTPVGVPKKLEPVGTPNQHCIDESEADTQIWNDVVHLSGAALDQSKCSHHFATCDFALSGPPITAEGTFDPGISIKFN